MPHDQNGKPLSVGDEVVIPARIKDIQVGEEYCNVTLETRQPMPPYTTPSTIVLNTRQVVKGNQAVSEGNQVGPGVLAEA